MPRAWSDLTVVSRSIDRTYPSDIYDVKPTAVELGETDATSTDASLGPPVADGNADLAEDNQV